MENLQLNKLILCNYVSENKFAYAIIGRLNLP